MPTPLPPSGSLSRLGFFLLVYGTTTLDFLLYFPKYFLTHRRLTDHHTFQWNGLGGSNMVLELLSFQTPSSVFFPPSEEHKDSNLPLILALKTRGYSVWFSFTNITGQTTCLSSLHPLVVFTCAYSPEGVGMLKRDA